MSTFNNGYNIGDIKSLLHEAEHPTYTTRVLSLQSVNILTQVRTEFGQESLEELAQNIALNGLIQPSTVAQFDPETAKGHIRIINHIHKKSHDINDLVTRKKKGEVYYYMLLAGERRYRAINLLYERGCRKCVEENGGNPLKKGECFQKHFKTREKKIRFSISKDVIPFQALLVQFSENDYVPPKPHEEARVYAPYYKLVKMMDPDYSLAKFSRRVSRGTEKLRNAIGYFDLPEYIQKYVEDGVISYGIANQLARLQEREINGEKLGWWLTEAIIRKDNVRIFKKKIDIFLQECNSRQMTLIEIWEEGNKDMRRPRFRAIIDPEIDKTMLKDNIYVRNIARLIEDGLLVKEDKIYSTTRSKSHLFELVDAQDVLLPKLEEIMSKPEFEKFTIAFSKIRTHVKKMTA